MGRQDFENRRCRCAFKGDCGVRGVGGVGSLAHFHPSNLLPHACACDPFKAVQGGSPSLHKDYR